MSLFTKFNVNYDAIGKVRRKYLEKIDSTLGEVINPQTLIAPLVEEEEKHGLGKKILFGQSSAQKTKERFLMLTGQVLNQSFQNLVACISPIPISGKIIFEEYTYTTLLPYPIDASLFYAEKRGVMSGKKGFYMYPNQLSVPPIPEDQLFNSESPLPYELSNALQQTRLQLSVQKDLKKLMIYNNSSFVSSHLNSTPQLPSLIKRMTALPEVNKVGVKIKNSIGVTAILIPNEQNTIIQIGDFKLKPNLAFDILNLLSFKLKEAFELYRQQQPQIN